MKIAILTQPITCNYGGILQNYALQTVLERMGHTVATLDYPQRVYHYDNALHRLLSICHRTLLKLSGDSSIHYVDVVRESKKGIKYSQSLKPFLEKYLHLKEMDFPLTKKDIEKGGYDAFVVGSDQVWRPRYAKGNGHLLNMFLDFTSGMNVKRIAYAASFGSDRWEIPESLSQTCRELAGKFDAISVRERSGVKLCKDNLDVDAVQVPDPTLLLSTEDYLALCSGREHPECEYIAVYMLDRSKKKLDLLEEVSKRLGLPLHIIGGVDKNGCRSIGSWIEGIAGAKYVITDSFHGTVFSIIFHKQFVTLGNAVRGNSRFDSLFSTLGISEERMVNCSDDVVIQLNTTVNYSAVDRNIAQQRELAEKFLKQF